ncbi:MAG: hypothetical protein FVQ85_21630 [Planctomycetes bacterium]|nr:hypothetical protein [Planctomycetota bacterium]
MKGLIVVKDKETGEIYQSINVWVVLLLLNIYDECTVDTDKVEIFIDGQEIPRPEGMNNDRHHA